MPFEFGFIGSILEALLALVVGSVVSSCMIC